MPRRPSQSDYTRFFNAVSGRMDGLIDGYEAGRYDEAELHDRMAGLLADRHGRATYLGRARGGDLSPYDDDDRTFGLLQAELEEPFLTAFMDDLRNGRYLDGDGLLKGTQVRYRAHMYVERLLGTASEAFVLASYEDELIFWMLGAVEDHCDDCPRLAAGGPYRPSALPTYPGASATQCVTKCKCHLQRGGVNCFENPQ
jgi:hypothetical protein